MRTLILAVVLMLTAVTSLRAETSTGHNAGLATVLDPAVTGGQSYSKSTEARILAAMEKSCLSGRPDFSKSSLGSVSIPSITPPSSSY